MRVLVQGLLLLGFGVLLLGCAAGRSQVSASAAEDVRVAVPADALRVMSFNIRYPNPRDGHDYWPVRAGRVISAIEAFGPDVLGLQEAYDYQVEVLLFHMKQYELVGVGREDGKDRGEMTGILYRRDRFTLIDHGHFWLSPTPHLPGSVGWDAALTRMATWLALEDRKTGRRWVVLNTHFDHRGRAARVESARLLRQRIAELRQRFDGAPAILTGDFNADAGGPVYQALGVGGPDAGLIDTHLADLANLGQPDGTFNFFRGETNSARIDWIIVSDNVEVLEARIDRNTYNDRYPSDHYPVTAVVR